MGIPSYFSYIVKNYTNIIQTSSNIISNVSFASLYMDCNSIIYDAVRSIEVETKLDPIIDINIMETAIINRVVEKIDEYVAVISPTGTIFISFDGVAPMAKMEQQRSRRYKSAFMESIDFGDNDTIPNIGKFSTTAITPGTHFMKKLSMHVNRYFVNKNNYIVSASDVAGEGENKMFQHIRENVSSKDIVAVYGLDADLIMLSLFHCDMCKNIFIYREAPAFIGNYISIDPNCKVYLMDISQLSSAIVHEMNVKYPSKTLIHDYMFLCFMLGNDFLPHFPALNIRTHGIQVLLDVYRNVIGRYKGTRLVDEKKIIWKNVSKFVKELAFIERGLLIQEYASRERFDLFKVNDTTVKDRREVVENTPILYRGEELFISPKEFWWENRYYESLFRLKRVEPVVKDVCINYIEGLEWTLNYYVSDCKSWEWKYNYDYPPLLCDLTRYIPSLDTVFIHPNNSEPVLPEVQLAYVIPETMQHLLPDKIRNHINKHYKTEMYPEKYVFKWSFCRYLWESHIILPEISDNILIDLSRLYE